jgi:hypothetical protein
LKDCCRRIEQEEPCHSGVGNPRQEDPQKSVFPLGGDSSDVVVRGNFDLALKPAVVDLHGDNSHRFARRGKGQLVLLQRFRRLPVSPDPDSPRLYFHFDLAGFNAGQFNTDPEAGGALEDVDRRAPLNAGITKIGEMNLRDLIGDLSNLTFEKPQAKRTGFSAHDS